MEEQKSGCAGCGSTDSETNFDDLSLKMEETKKMLEKMNQSVDGLSIDVDFFSSVENKLSEMGDYLKSGEFFESLKGAMLTPEQNEMFKENMNSAQSARTMANWPSSPAFNMPNIPNWPTTNIPAPNKIPVGWVYVDENGQQQFSPTEPQGVTSTPVYT